MAALAFAIPTRDRVDDLRQTLVSVVPAAVTCDAEIVICDQSADAFSDSGPWRVLHEPGITSLPAARNHLLAHIDADVVVFLDDDVDLAADVGVRLLACLRRRPGCVACGPVIETRTANRIRLHRLLQLGAQRDPRRLLDRHRTCPTRALFGCCFAVRRQAALAVGFETGRDGYALGEDFDFFLRLPGEKLFIAGVDVRHRESGVGRADRLTRGQAKARWFRRLARQHGDGNPASLLHLGLALLAAAGGGGREPGDWRGVWRGLRDRRSD